MSQQQNQPQAPAKGTPEYNQKMVELFEKQGGQFDAEKQTFAFPAQKAEKPASVPDKFWDAEKGVVNYDAWSKSTSELEKKLTQNGQQKPNGEQKPAGDDAAAQNAVAQAGLKWDDLGAKIAKDGKIDDADYAALEKVGIPKEIVDTYIGALTTATQAARAETEKYVGGKEVLEKMLNAAATELDPEERDAFNKQLANPKTAKAALDVLKARFAPDDGEPNGQINGGGSGSRTVVGFASAYEQNEAINKKNDRGQRLYDIDPAYRNTVRQRIAMSKF